MRKRGSFIRGGIFASLFALVMFANPSAALTTVPTKMNFQGRLANSAGNILADGTYNMKFRIYDASSGGTLQWSEDRLVSASQGVTVANGQFSVQLGSITSLPASIFTSNSLYFEVELPTPATATSSSPSWAEGPMTPRSQLATSAYAYNAETLDGLDSDDFSQLSGSNLFTEANVFRKSSDSTSAFDIQNSLSQSLFTADTSNMGVTVNGSIDQTGSKLTLKGTLPTGTNYNPRELDIVGNYAYIIGQRTTGPLLVVDVTDPASPTAVGSLSDALLSFARDIRVVGRYAYIATYDARLVIADIANPASPTIVGSVQDATYLNNGHGLEVQGRYAYLTGSNGVSGGYLTVVDISNPTSPTVVANASSANLVDAKQVDINGKYAYVTSGSVGNGGLVIVDISNPLSPTVVGNINSSAYGVSRDVVANGKYAYVVSADDDKLSIFDVSNPTSPTLVGSITDSTNMDEPYDVTLNGNYAYVASSTSTNIAVVDISDPTSPTIVSGAGYSATGATFTAAQMNGRYLYAVANIADTTSVVFRIFDTGGATFNATTTGTLHTHTLQVEGTADIANDLNVGDALSVGQGGINTDGVAILRGGASIGSLFTVDTASSVVRVGSTTADSTGIVLVLDTKNTSGDPTGVDGAMYYNSNLQAFRCYQSGEWRSCIGGLATSSTSAQTISGTTATDFTTTYTIPANACVPGKVYRITARGVYSTNLTGGNTTISVAAGSTTLLSSTVALGGSANNRQWVLSADVICQTTGATGTVEAAGTFMRFTGAAASASTEMVNTAAVTLDTTAAQTLKVSSQANQAATSITVRQVIIESLGP